MSDLKELNEYVNEVMMRHPSLKEEVVDLFQLAISEISDGDSEWNECQLATGSIMDLIEEL